MKAKDLLHLVSEGDFDVSGAIKELIDAEPTNDKEKQGKFVQLLKGMAFSDDKVSDQFMSKLMGLVSKENFGDLLK